MAKAARHVRMQKAMEEMFAGFAPDGKASGDVSAGSETSLYGIANGFVFFLNFFADFHACLVFLFGLLAHIGKIVVEDDGTFVHRKRQDEIRVHNSFIRINHKIRINPEIERAALSRSCDILFGFCAGAERARLQARALEILDGITGVFNDAAESFVRVRNVIAAVEIIVHVHFPIALQRVDAATEILEFLGQLERRDQFRNFAEKILQRAGFAVEIDEDKIFPYIHFDGNEAVFRAVKIADSFKFDHTFERAIVAISPAVIRAAEILGATFRFGDHGGGVMPADIIKSAENSVVAAGNDNGFTGEVCGEEITFVLDLIGASGNLPVSGKNRFVLQASNARIEIPRRGDGPCFFKWVVGIVEPEKRTETTFHDVSSTGEAECVRILFIAKG